MLVAEAIRRNCILHQTKGCFWRSLRIVSLEPHMHHAATKAANNGTLGPVDASGWVRLDGFGKVIDAGWISE